MPLPLWSQFGSHFVFYHGTVRSAVARVTQNGINLAAGRPDLDFGLGFYTTTKRDQAEQWARKKYRQLRPRARRMDRPAVLSYRLPLDRLAGLGGLAFVRGSAKHVAYWSFVSHCRSGSPGHCRPGRQPPDDYYDYVAGPVAAGWPPAPAVVIPDSDQFSFHTSAATAILDDVMRAGPPAFEVAVL